MSEEKNYKKGEDHYEKLKAKLFDNKEFNTIIISSEGTVKKQEELDELISSLTDRSLTMDEKEEAFRLIKERDGKAALLQAIRNTKSPEKKALLIAAVWEINFNLADEFLFFTDLVCSSEFTVALEALTVIENMEHKIKPEDISKARQMVQARIQDEPDTLPLLEDLLSFIDNSAAQ